MRTNLLSLKTLLVICLLAIVGGEDAWADTYKYTFTSSVFKKTSTTSKENLETQKLGDVSWTTSGVIPYLGSNATKGMQFGSNKKPANFSIFTSDISGTITSVKINASKNSDGSSSLTVSVGGSQYGKTESLTSSATDYTFEGSSLGEINISMKSVSTGAYIKSIEITYTPSSGSSVATPTITPASQEFSTPFTATIACATTGATIYYTLDGTDPTSSTTRQTYTSAGVSIPAATTTLKACAALNGENSSVASATYTYVPTYANLKELKANAESGKTYKVQLTDAIVTLANGYNCYIEDATAGILYYKSSHGYKAGDKLNGVATVTYTIHEGQNEITSLEGDITKETGATIPCTSVSLSDILNNTAQYESMRVKVEMVVAKEEFSSSDRSATIADGDLELSLFNGYGSTTYKDFRVNAYVNVTGYPYTFEKNSTSTPTLKVWTGDIEAVKDDAVTITDAQYGTAYYADAFFMPTGATGYIAESNGNGGITLKETYAEGDLVPAKTALVLNAPKGKYDICLAESEDVAPANNLLHGTATEDFTVVEGGTYKYYKLSYDSNGENLGFYYEEPNGAEFINGAHKAFLAIPTTNGASMAKGFALNDLFNGSEVTGINHATVATKSAAIYDLNGRRINSLSGAAKGIYIMNGQKVLVK